MERFLFQYSHALKLQKEEKYKIVYTDESWANTGTTIDHSWIHKCEHKSPDDCIICAKYIELENGDDCKAGINKSNVGKRCVFIHAFTQDFLLSDYANHQVPSFSDLENLDLKLNTCEYILECKNDNSSDYHEQMDNIKYIKYFENRLINSFIDLYQNNKKAIYYIDQAPFHVMYSGFPLSTDPKEK